MFTHYHVGLWVPEVGGAIDPGSEAHDLVMNLFGGLSNALLGACYYPALAIVTWLSLGRAFALFVFAIVLVAAAVSVVLGYSLLFVTRRPCAYCWPSHAINALLVILFALHLRPSL